MRSKILYLGVTLLVTAVLVGCSGGSASMSVNNGKGHIAIHLTDAPLDLSTVASVTVTIESVMVYPGVEEIDGSGTSPIVLMTTPATFDLLTLTGGATTLLADGDVPAGLYQRIRIGISSATLLFKDDRQEDLKIESRKVDIPIPFEVSIDEALVVTLDFDAGASVKVNETAQDKYILRPVVTPVQL
jgi:hypothetical protein